MILQKEIKKYFEKILQIQMETKIKFYIKFQALKLTKPEF
jgi:hypothetical protein